MVLQARAVTSRWRVFAVVGAALALIVSSLALATKAIEAAGLAAALVLLPRPKGHPTWIAHARRAPSRSA